MGRGKRIGACGLPSVGNILDFLPCSHLLSSPSALLQHPSILTLICIIPFVTDVHAIVSEMIALIPLTCIFSHSLWPVSSACIPLFSLLSPLFSLLSSYVILSLTSLPTFCVTPPLQLRLYFLFELVTSELPVPDARPLLCRQHIALHLCASLHFPTKS